APPTADAKHAGRSRAKRWRSEGKGVTNFLGVHTDERARNGDVGKNSSSSERDGGVGRKTSLGNERGTTSESKTVALKMYDRRNSANSAPRITQQLIIFNAPKCKLHPAR
ncbi:hypothetical protein THAOC_21947, partial [Thalassiosira oceanica]